MSSLGEAQPVDNIAAHSMDGELPMPDFCEAKQDLLVYTAICPRIVAASSRHMVLT